MALGQCYDLYRLVDNVGLTTPTCSLSILRQFLKYSVCLLQSPTCFLSMNKEVPFRQRTLICKFHEEPSNSVEEEEHSCAGIPFSKV